MDHHADRKKRVQMQFPANYQPSNKLRTVICGE